MWQATPSCWKVVKGKEKETEKGKSSVEGYVRCGLAHFIRLPHVRVAIRNTAREGKV